MLEDEERYFSDSTCFSVARSAPFSLVVDEIQAVLVLHNATIAQVCHQCERFHTDLLLPVSRHFLPPSLWSRELGLLCWTSLHPSPPKTAERARCSFWCGCVTRGWGTVRCHWTHSSHPPYSQGLTPSPTPSRWQLTELFIDNTSKNYSQLN